MRKKALKVFLLVILFTSVQSFTISGKQIQTEEVISQPLALDPIPYFENVVFITWDGTNSRALEQFIDDGTLVHTKKIDQIGYRQTVRITSHSTATDPGLACMESGYGDDINNIPYNMFYHTSPIISIPDNYTIMERLKETYGDSVKTVFVFSWGLDYVNFDHIDQLPSRDPIFDNMKPEIDYRFASENLSWTPGDPDSLAAAYHEYNEYTEKFSSPVTNAYFLGDKSAELLTNVITDRFYLRVHLTEPDQAGHTYGVWSEEYKQSLIDCDYAVGKILDELETAGIMNETLVIIGTDHGFYADGHSSGPWVGKHKEITSMTYIISNSSVMNPYGIPVNQKDLAPTILSLMGVDVSLITPAYDGGAETGIPFWDLTDIENPTISKAKYNFLGTTYEDLTAETKLTDVFNISLSIFDWDENCIGELQVDDLTFESIESDSFSVLFSNIDLTDLKNGKTTFNFTVTDSFGNVGIYEITARLKLASISIWLSITGFLAIGTYIVVKRRKR
ncbi:MAG: hypothetical protein HeimAB125_05650 [Candidatus Heimdallarchaeota archaeon AB_125]|nr:MAG: hypothetical protein HeimAB125_05650 [Candidatus Heimdallarchaeota archaeon AB_125]